MSYNQPRSDKNEAAQIRKQGRQSNSSNSHRSSSSGLYNKAGGAPAPAFSSSQPANRSFKKPGNAQGGPAKSNLASANAPLPSSALDSSVEFRSNSSTAFQNGLSHTASSQNPVHGNSDSSYASRLSRQGETPSNRSNSANAPKDPASVRPALMSDASPNAPSTPVKTSGDSSKAPFPLQFGSLSPGVVNGMQIPARTSSAPPNLDEQKRDQARIEHMHTMAPVPVPVPLPNQKRGDVAVEKTIAVESHQFPKVKQNTPVPVSVPTIAQAQAQKPPVIPYGVASMQAPFHHSQAAVQFGSSAQIPPQGVTVSAHQMQLPVALPQVQQPLYVQAQGMIHPGQSLNFPGQMGHQLPPQLSNMGIGITPHYPQQGGKYGRKTTVKITDPKTNEELRLADGGQSGMRPHSNVPQSQPNPSFSHYYSTSYDGGSIYFPAPGSMPLQSWPMAPASQPSRYNYTKQQGMPFIDHSSINPHSINKSPSVVHGTEHLNIENCRDSRIPTSTVPVIVKPPSVPLPEKVSKPVLSSKDAMSHSLKSTSDGYTKQSIVVGKPKILEVIETNSLDSEDNKCEEVVIEKRSEETIEVSNSSMDSVQVDKIPSPVHQTTETASLQDESSDRHVSSHVNRQEKSDIASPSSPSGEAIAHIANKTDDYPSISPKTSVEVVLKSVLVHGPTLSEDLAEEKLSDIKQEYGISFLSNEVLSENEELNISEARSGSEAVVTSDDSCRVDHVLNETGFVNEDSNASSLEKIDSVDGNKRVATKPTEENPTCTYKEKTDNLGESTKRDIEGVPKEKALAELNRTKSCISRGKKKRKEFLQKADAAGSSSDLYLAYKGPEEKIEIETPNAIETVEKPETPKVEKATTKKTEPEDWEDAVDISTPKLDLPDTLSKRYSRDFLLKFSDRFTDLPDGFEVTPDIAETVSINAADARPSSGRNMDRTNSSRIDRRGGSMGDDDRWKGQGGNVGYNNNNANFRPGQGGNFGVLRGPRPQTQQYVGGILSGPMQYIATQGQSRASRNSFDNDMWQRGGNFQQKGLIPSPHGPMQAMHKAENRYEVRKISSEEEAKQRQLKAILNKLTPQKFDKLFEQVKDVHIDSAETLTGVINQIFDKALMEPTFCEMYANFCFHLAGELPDFVENEKKVSFKRLLLNKCQEEFERGEREQQEADKVEEGNEMAQSLEEREAKRFKARRRMLGNIRLIGELYKKKMLTERIMHECIKKLLGEYLNPEEEDLEALCKLMSTIGEMIDHIKSKDHIDVYFERMYMLSDNMNLSSRIRFMLKDAIDLRKNKWQQRRKVEGPKKIDDVHRDAAQERSLQARNLSRTPSANQLRRGVPDFGQRGGPSANQVSGMRNRNQDMRYEERQSFDSRALAPLPQRTTGEDLITLGPQGGLARGMSGFNGIQREDHFSRSDQDRSLDKSVIVSPSRAPPLPSPKLTEEMLEAKSLAAVKEFYSAKDVKEVALCIKELNSPGFHPAMISLWVNDSFERKDMERDLLGELIVNLSQSDDSVLTRTQFLMGLEEILGTLEDAVNDAPRAAEFLGRVVGKVVAEEVVGVEEVGRLLRDGGEERGRLLEIGVAGDVLGGILDFVKAEKGDALLSQIELSSSFVLKDFLPQRPFRAKLLEKFV